MKRIGRSHLHHLPRLTYLCIFAVIALTLLRVSTGSTATAQPAGADTQTTPVDPDAVVILPLEEGVGTIAGDVSGMGNNGVLVNGAAFEPTAGDGSNFAVRFDGVDDYIDLGGVDVDAAGLTLAAWFYAESFPGPSSDPRLISKASGSSANAHVFMLSTIQSSGSVRLRARVRVGGVTTTLIASSGDVLADTWQHGALTYDGSALRLYLDGAQVGSTPLSGAVDQDPAMPVAVGAQPPGLDPRFFDGLLDDVRILQRALSAAEVAAIAGANQLPIASDDGYAIVEDTPYVVGALGGVLANDSDPDLDSLQALIESDVTNGVLNLNTDGSFSYTPNDDFNGVDYFAYRAFDGSTTSNVATVTLNIGAVNDLPVATDDGYQTEPNTALTVAPTNGVLSNDVDVDSDPLRAVLVGDVSHGVLTLSTDGSFIYSPSVDFLGADSFTYRASDVSGHPKAFDDKPRDEPSRTSGVNTSPNLATVTIVVAQPPSATGDGYITGEDTPLVVAAINGVLANDTDNNPPTDLTAVIVTGPTRGILLSFTPDGAFTYEPDPDSNGVDTFAYAAVDGVTGATDTASVMLTVNAVNDAPVAANDYYQTQQNAPLAITALNGVLTNDSDVESSLLQTILVDDVGNGALTLNADGSFNYSPNLNFVGTDSFTYRADDLDLTSNLATVTIDVTGSAPDEVVVLPLNDGGGTIATDVSGNGNDGTLIGGAAFESSTGDGSPWSVRFDGVDDYIDLGGVDVDGSGLTLAAWFKADAFPETLTDPRLISKASGNGTNSHVFMLSMFEQDGVERLRGRVRVGGTTTTLIAASGGVIPGDWHHATLTYDGSAMRLYLDGVEVGNTPLTGSVDKDPSMPVAVGGQPPGLVPRYFDGLIDDVRILQRALSPAEISAIAGPAPGPVVDVWYGDVQNFGDKGNPQTLIQILGRVRETAPLTNLSYRLNGGASQSLSVGPDFLRLVSWGDFNIEIDNSSLNAGANTVEITAVDAIAEQTVKTVTVNYTPGVVWPLPETLDWQSASVVTDEAQVVDGLWQLEADGVRTVSNAIGYDRLLVAGDYTWVPDYEAVGSVTVHEIWPNGAAGFAVGWQGHNGPQDPMLGHPYEALAWIMSTGILQMLRNGDGIEAEQSVGLTLGTEYVLKVRSETLGGGQSNVRVKWWAAASQEPGNWNMDETVSTVNGSLLLVAHRADVTFGEIVISPLAASAAAPDQPAALDARQPPAVLTVRQNFPNPFSTETEIVYGLPSSGEVGLEIYTVAGRRVFASRKLFARSGWDSFSFDGARLATGVYFYKITTAQDHTTRKMVIMR